MKHINLLMAVCFLGIIDQIHGRDVLVEFATVEGEYEYIHFPLESIPCEVREGDTLQFIKNDNSFVITCERECGQ